jgi:hypothetical protein
MAPERFGAIELPDQLGRRVKMAHAKIAVDDHDGIARPIQRRKQDVWGFDYRIIVSAHRPILMPVYESH